MAGLSVLRRRNQALPMRRVDGAGPDLVRRNPVWRAALLLACVVAFVGRQWQQSPQGLLPAQGAGQAWGERHHDDDD